LDDDTRAVLDANERFYRAFRERDIETLESLWSRVHPVAVIHPGWPALHGRSAVMESWRDIVAGPAPPDIQCDSAHAVVIGGAAFVTCVESLADGALVATNLFVREENGSGVAWRMVHHQAGPAPPALRSAAPDSTVH
jgi:ketosteroid isomerase-like protein